MLTFNLPQANPLQVAHIILYLDLFILNFLGFIEPLQIKLRMAFLLHYFINNLLAPLFFFRNPILIMTNVYSPLSYLY
jgi:hypothetical protein